MLEIFERLVVFVCIFLIWGCTAVHKAQQHAKYGNWMQAYNEVVVGLEKKPDDKKLNGLKRLYASNIVKDVLNEVEELENLNLSGKISLLTDVIQFDINQTFKIEKKISEIQTARRSLVSELNTGINSDDIQILTRCLEAKTEFLKADDQAFTEVLEDKNIKEMFYDEIEASLFVGEHFKALDQLNSFQVLEGLFGEVFLRSLENRIFASMKNQVLEKINFLQPDDDKLTKVMIDLISAKPVRPIRNIKVVVENFDDYNRKALPQSIPGFNLKTYAKSEVEKVQLSEFDFGLCEIKLDDFYINEPSSKEIIYSKFFKGTRSVVNPKYAQIEHNYNLASNVYNRALKEYQISMNNWNISVQNARAYSTRTYIISPPAQPVPPDNTHLRILENNLNSTPRLIQEKVYSDYELIKQTTYRSIELVYSYGISSMDGRKINSAQKQKYIYEDEIVNYLNLHPEDIQYQDKQPGYKYLKLAKSDHARDSLPKLLSKIFSELSDYYVKNQESYFRQDNYYNLIRYLLYFLPPSSSELDLYNQEEVTYLYDLFENGLEAEELFSHAFSLIIKNLFSKDLDSEKIYKAYQNAQKKIFKPYTISFAKTKTVDPVKPKKYSTPIEQVIKSTFTIKLDKGHGSAFVFHKPNLLVTNYHVVGDNEEVRCFDHTGKMVMGKVIDRHKSRDLALIEIPEDYVPVKPHGNLQLLDIGTRLYAIGTPKDYTLRKTVTQGVLSAVRKMDWGGNWTFVQTDTPINPGNSGGPLITKDGKLVGVNTRKYVGVSVEGLTFAIPVNEISKHLSLP